MHYGNIKPVDIANGEGIRVTLFVSGCRHHCKNCFNPETWNFDYGNKFDQTVEDQILSYLDHDFIKGLTLLGGEPMEPENQEGLLPFIRRFREKFGTTKNIWSYTGFVYDKDLIAGGRAYTKYTDELLSNIDVLVDGPFIESLKNLSLNFRGSSNQRIIDLKKTRNINEIVLYMN